jgi:hypothetical protein
VRSGFQVTLGLLAMLIMIAGRAVLGDRSATPTARQAP